MKRAVYDKQFKMAAVKHAQSVDQSVSVYVDPDNPACFVLGSERDSTKTSILIGFLVLFVLMIALAVLNTEITDSRKRQDTIIAAISEMEE